MRRIAIPLITLSLLVPAVAFAARAVTDFKSFICLLVDLINPILVLLSGLAVLAFLWGVTKYIWNAGNEGKKEEGRQVMVYGLIGLFVFFSFWGIIKVVQNTFNFGGGGDSPASLGACSN